MPKFQYTNQPNKKFELLPDGDYLLEIVGADPCISTAEKYRGSEQFELKFRSVEHGTEFKEWLTFHQDLDWKVDNFLTCFNYGATPGQEIDIEADRCLGLRGWCAVGHYEKNGKKYNQVRVYYTDKAKLPPPAVPVEEDPWA
jgi:hypothetical protein